MNLEKQFSACAELDGWKYILGNKATGQPPHWEHLNDERSWCYSDFPANYNSRDVLVELVEKCCPDWDRQDIFITQLLVYASDEPSRGDLMWLALTLTPAQLREALLRSVGKWKD